MDEREHGCCSKECGGYNIPFEILRWRANHILPLECQSGPPTVLTDDEEHQLAVFCVTPFQMDQLDIYTWFDGSRAHHPNLTLRSAQSLSHSHAACVNRSHC